MNLVKSTHSFKYVIFIIFYSVRVLFRALEFFSYGKRVYESLQADFQKCIAPQATLVFDYAGDRDRHLGIRADSHGD